jgi:spermidine/putrescine transport system ATP-binding protein
MNDNIVTLRHVSKSFHHVDVLHDINLAVKSGEFLTILGPSGCGKTTLIRLISGLESVSGGEIFIQNKKINDVSAHKRQVNSVFQDYALFPHMTVYDNVAFGLRCQKIKASVLHERVTQALAMVKLQDLTQRKPAQLSGGQRQRVAIARAAVNKPLVLLLDEPLSALDYRLRQEMQLELKSLQRQLGITFILVTHDQEEALSISDRIVVMDEGRIAQIGTPREIYESPANLTVATFIGRATIFKTTVESIEENNIQTTIASRPFTLKTTQKLTQGQHINVLIRPEDFSVWDRSETDPGEKKEMIPGVVEHVIYKGSTVDLQVRAQSGELILATEFFDEDDENLNYRIGEQVWVEWQQGWEEILLS